MRLRKRKGSREKLEQMTDLVVLEPERYCGRWKEFFGNDRPIHVELGMGKGKFISEMSWKFPEINFIGVDRYDELIYRASEKSIKLWEEKAGIRPPNLALVLLNIEGIEKAFGEGEIERIYLNFSDPWPKRRHAKRRLTHPRFLQKYAALLNEKGEIHFKTDSKMLFEFSLNTFSDMGFRLHNITFDLHNDERITDNIMTEYEIKFHEQGVPIYRCEAIVGKEALENLRIRKEKELSELLNSR